jgi:NADH dehydrogenase
MAIIIPSSPYKRIVIVGAGFGGLKLGQELANTEYQVVLIDKYNYHQFQPLFYQVATAGLEPSAISFPLRKIFHKAKNVHIRVTEIEKVDPAKKVIHTGLGELNYDYLILAVGAGTNFFGLKNLIANSITMKSVSEALGLRNKILQNLENALNTTNAEERVGLMNIVVVGGGPTGVEVSGTLAEMKRDILPKDYPELDFSEMNIYLLEASPNVLNVMAPISSKKSKEYLEKLGVKVSTGTRVKDYDGKYVYLSDSTIRTDTLIWAAGVSAIKVDGIDQDVLGRGGRIKVDRFNKVEGQEFIYAIGDLAIMTEEKFPDGHPQLAQAAIQQANNVAKNFKNLLKNKPLKQFKYSDLGSMATVGKNLAVVELPFIKFQGFLAWLTWMFVHLMSIVGVKNRLFIFINWLWNYVTSDQSLRLIIKPKEKILKD